MTEYIWVLAFRKTFPFVSLENIEDKDAIIKDLYKDCDEWHWKCEQLEHEMHPTVHGKTQAQHDEQIFKMWKRIDSLKRDNEELRCQHDDESIRLDERRKIYYAIRKMIHEGRLGDGDGTDRNAQRNGIILRNNLVFQMGIT